MQEINNVYRPIGSRDNMRGGFKGGKSFQRIRGTAGRVQVRSCGRRTARGNLAVNSSNNTNEKEVIDEESERKVVNPKSTGFFSSSAAWGGGCVFHPLCKIRCRHPQKLKLTGLIAHIIMFYKICKF